MTNTPAPLVKSGARRGCGYRQPGAAYFAVPLGPGGRPIEEFLIDPPVVIDDPARLGLASVGVTLIERDGITWVLCPRGGLIPVPSVFSDQQNSADRVSIGSLTVSGRRTNEIRNQRTGPVHREGCDRQGFQKGVTAA